MKGLVFTTDAMFAVLIVFIILPIFIYVKLQTQTDEFNNLYLTKFANDVLIVLKKSGALETLNKTIISNSLSEILPPNLGAYILRTQAYNCSGPSCTSFSLSQEIIIDTCKIRVVDIMLIIDRSGSMDDDCPGGSANPGETPCKINDAKNAAKNFLDQLDNQDRAGLVSFSSTAVLDQGLTPDKGLVKTKIDSLIASGSTNIGDGIYTATNELRINGRSSVSRVEVLLTDGKPNEPGNDIFALRYSLNAAKNASSYGIPIYTIGLGSGVNATLLEEIANITGGKYYFAPSGAQLTQIYLAIAKEIFRIEPEPPIATTSFLVFKNHTMQNFGIADLRFCLK